MRPHGQAPAARPGAGPAAPSAPYWPLVGLTGALAATWMLRAARPEAPRPVCGVTLAPQAPAEPLVAMRTAGGRRKRLGVGGRVCMLTGRKKRKGFYRTFSEKKNKRYWRPNTRWKKFWWEREKKWVRLYVSTRAIRTVDNLGLERAASIAGLDLYAWSLPHWLPGSRQPLALKVGYTAQAKRDRRLWPDYMPKLNKEGKPLAEIFPDPHKDEEKRAFRPRPWTRAKGEGTPPKRLKVTAMEL